jgi:hypothetical protein
VLKIQTSSLTHYCWRHILDYRACYWEFGTLISSWASTTSQSHVSFVAKTNFCDLVTGNDIHVIKLLPYFVNKLPCTFIPTVLYKITSCLSFFNASPSLSHCVGVLSWPYVYSAEYNPDQYLWEPEFTLAGRKYKRLDLEASKGDMSSIYWCEDLVLIISIFLLLTLTLFPYLYVAAHEQKESDLEM